MKDKEDTMFKKKSMRNKIVEMEESCKDSILEFITRKNHTIHEGIFAERDVYLNKKKKK